MAQAYDMALAKLAIQDLAALYMRGLDRLDRDLFRAQFWDDAFLDYGIYAGGADGFADFCMAALEGHDRNHHIIGQHIIDIDGDEGFGEVYYQAYHKVPQESGEPHDVFVSGRYLDRYEKRGDVWKFAYRSEIVDWASDMPSSDQFLDPRMIVGKRKPDDSLYDRQAMRRKSGDSDGL
ncbi:nuclear transport factor 2 family protein [Parasphingorhabdus cellanae]|uniref:Nuclear transport factor 2 family protein n=1 Tax=Parasphingorhabdus cellanae TaxID=2806553 RepID=A0ABX7T734_9SPHN|nr:nuclear transport factor 2 family protein [Parasphingorhabdus cellanae]QTD57415.1 nuclear transport factor 2 family protein [Parasphingorhabdus cellanae]